MFFGYTIMLERGGILVILLVDLPTEEEETKCLLEISRAPEDLDSP